MTSTLGLRNPSTFICSTILTLSLLICAPSYSQVVGATLSGTITDPSDAVVPNVTVSVSNVATGITRNTTTDSSGFYAVPNLVPGTYAVMASAPGFSTLTQSGIELTVGSKQVLNITMRVGSVTDRVQVTAEAPTVELESSSLTNAIDAKTVRDLPLNGRDWTQLATLQPGVTSLASLQPDPSTVGGNQRGNRGFGTQLAISGARPEQNNYRLDGISVSDYNNESPGNPLGVAVGVDAIQEFTVVTSNYSAEYGRTSGGVINAITRSGTNQFHGGVFEFLRNSALDARNFFDAAKIPAFRRNQFGAFGGAPIKKDKTFIFANYEGLRQFLGTTQTATVPSDTARTGLLHYTGTPPAGCVATSSTQCQVTPNPTVLPFLALYPHFNAGILGAGDTAVYQFVSQQVASENFVTTRFDHRFSDKDSIFGTYQHDHALVTLPDVLNNLLTNQITGSQHAAIEESHIFSTRLINAARFGFNRVTDVGGGGLTALNPAVTNTAFGAVPGRTTVGFTAGSGTSAVSGLDGQSQVKFNWTTYQWYDDLNFTVGKHSIKIGGNVERDQDNKTVLTGQNGVFTFPTLATFLQNQPTKFTVTFFPIKPGYLRDTIIGAYFQDDVRLRTNLTVNLGLRYEMSRVPVEKYGNIYTLPTPTSALATNAPVWANPTLRNFEPRVGFAWDPFGNGKTSVRSSFGMFDVLPLPYIFHISGTQVYPAGISAQVNQGANLPQGSFPTAAYNKAAAELTTSTLPLQHEMYIDHNPPRSYVMQWNLSLQREVLSGLTVMTTYLGSRGVHAGFISDDMNLVLPTLSPAGYLWPKVQGTPLNPNFGRIDNMTWNNDAFYHAFQAQVTKRLTHGLQVQGSYTFSKSIDSGSGVGLGDPFSNSINGLVFSESQFNRALSDYNVKHNLVINSVWTAPKPNLGNSAVDYALGGWQLGGILNVRTGLPFSVLIGGDPLHRLDTAPFDVPNRLTTGSGCDTAVNPGSVQYINLSCFTLPQATSAIASQCAPFGSVAGTCANLQGNAGRNSLIGPGLADLDFSVFKNNYLGHSERVNLQFRTEIFNILNHTNFKSPVSRNTLFNADGSTTAGAGAIIATSTTSRQIQFAMKLIW